VSDDHDFLTVEDVVLLHQEQLARYGGGEFVHEDLFTMAAALVFLDLEGLGKR
jgi:hypothetical protein